MIILDTNILIDFNKIFEELKKFSEFGEPIILSATIKELERMRNRKAKLALKLIKHYKIKIIKTEEKNADDAILKFVKKGDIVATNDIKLIKKLKSKKIKILRMREKKYLIVQN